MSTLINESLYSESESSKAKSAKAVLRAVVDPDFPEIDVFSSSTSSAKSVESDLDYRQRREKSFKFIKKLRRNTNSNTDPFVTAELSKQSSPFSKDISNLCGWPRICNPTSK